MAGEEAGLDEIALYASKQDLIAKTLQDDILTGRLRPGTFLRQEVLAKRFRVSPTPVREALRELGARGLVVHSLHRGFRIADVPADTLEEIVRIRALLEPYATEVATPLMGDDELAELRAINETIGDSSTSQEEMRILNRKLHMFIYEASASRHLLSLINLTWAAYPWRSLMLSASNVATVVAQHEAIIGAIGERDARRASKLMREHILGGLAQSVSPLA